MKWELGPFRLVGSLSIFAIETLLTLRGAELRSWWGRCTSAKHELGIIAKPWGLLHEALLSSPRNYSLPLQFVLFAARRFLQAVTYFVLRARPLTALLSLRSIC